MFCIIIDTTSGVRLYLNELITHISPNVTAQSWEIKRTAANALSTVAEKAGIPSTYRCAAMAMHTPYMYMYMYVLLMSPICMCMYVLLMSPIYVHVHMYVTVLLIYCILGSSLGPPHLAILLNTLLNGLQGRLWKGKETLLKSLKTVCVSCSNAIMDRQDDNQPDVNTVSDEEILIQSTERSREREPIIVMFHQYQP